MVREFYRLVGGVVVRRQLPDESHERLYEQRFEPPLILTPQWLEEIRASTDPPQTIQFSPTSFFDGNHRLYATVKQPMSSEEARTIAESLHAAARAGCTPSP